MREARTAAGVAATEEAGAGRPWLDLCFRVVKHELTALYPDATHLVAAHAIEPAALASALERYRLHAIRALLLAADGRLPEARVEAREALAQPGVEQGPPDQDRVAARLAALVS